MPSRARFIAIVLVAELACFAPSARADTVMREEPAYPVAYARRPLTVLQSMLAPSLGFAYSQVSVGGVTATGAGLAGGMTLGATDDLELRAVPIAVELTPNARYGNPTLGLTYRLTKGDVEAGFRFDATVITSAPAGAVTTLGVPLLVHLGRDARVDTGAFLPIRFQNSNRVVGAAVPISIAYNPVDVFYVRAASGVTITSFAATYPVTFPLILSAGATIPGRRGPALDIEPFFALPTFVHFGPGVDNPITNAWTAGVSITGYGYF